MDWTFSFILTLGTKICDKYSYLFTCDESSSYNMITRWSNYYSNISIRLLISFTYWNLVTCDQIPLTEEGHGRKLKAAEKSMK